MTEQNAIRRVLITGASIAGNAAAWWLQRRGFDVTVVERHPEFRDGGQNIDIRGAGREILAKMGLEQTVKDQGTGEAGIRFVDEHDNEIAEFDVDEVGAKGPTAELEILRGDLARVLYDACGDNVKFRFATPSRPLMMGQTPQASHSKAELKKTSILSWSLKALGPQRANLVFEGENAPRWLDVTMGYFTIPKGPGDDDHCRIYTAGEGRSIWLRPDNKGTTRAILVVQKDPEGEDALSPEQQKAFLVDHFRDVGWEAPRVLTALETTKDLYFDVLRQVKMERWSSGRVVLMGDAAWCATPIAGIGTTLAIVGSYVLAGELAKQPSLHEALERYDQIMRPFVEKGQSVPKLAPKMLQPQTRFGVALQRAVLQIAAAPGIKQVATKFFVSSADDIDLPNYDDN